MLAVEPPVPLEVRWAEKRYTLKWDDVRLGS